MLNTDLDLLRDYPFQRLNNLLADIKPWANEPPVVLTVGEPQNQPPPILNEAIAAHGHLWNKYPPLAGSPEFRQAVADWLARRYALPEGMVHPDKNVLPVTGTRVPLCMTGLVAVPKQKNGQRPVILMPNPLYHCYDGAAALSGAESVYMPCTRATGFLPDFGALSTELLDRVAIAYVCTPSNPQGAIASLDYLKNALKLARKHDFLLAVDECYAEIYFDRPPTGALEAARELGGSLDNLIIFHSLSKRSSAAGLRSGFIAADARIIEGFTRLFTYGGTPPPMPSIAAATALWRDEAHVEVNRAYYRANFDAADAVLRDHPGYYRPGAGFFLWLEVGDGEETTRRVWRDAGIRVMPGGYMARTTPDGNNPGREYIRIALVHDAAATEAALRRLARAL
jgi:aspartate/methionine/tyrosine aminotransferase